MTLVALSAIRLDGGTQSRAKLSDEVVAEYAEKLDRGVELPAPVVFHDGTEYWCADGFHRVHAFLKLGRKRIECDVHQGTLREAILYSVGANETHGLKRTNADKRRAVMLLLRDEEWAKKSDRWIAEKCSVSPDTVNRHRRELSDSDTSRTPRQGQDGKVRKLPTAAVKPVSNASHGVVEVIGAPEIPVRFEKLARQHSEESAASKPLTAKVAEFVPPPASTTSKVADVVEIHAPVPPAPPSAKWQCEECETWWSSDVKACQHCVEEDAVTWDPNAVASKFYDDVCRLMDSWEGDLRPLEDALEQAIARVRKRTRKAVND